MENSAAFCAFCPGLLSLKCGSLLQCSQLCLECPSRPSLPALCCCPTWSDGRLQRHTHDCSMKHADACCPHLSLQFSGLLVTALFPVQPNVECPVQLAVTVPADTCVNSNMFPRCCQIDSARLRALPMVSSGETGRRIDADVLSLLRIPYTCMDILACTWSLLELSSCCVTTDAASKCPTSAADCLDSSSSRICEDCVTSHAKANLGLNLAGPSLRPPTSSRCLRGPLELSCPPDRLHKRGQGVESPHYQEGERGCLFLRTLKGASHSAAPRFYLRTVWPRTGAATESPQ